MSRTSYDLRTEPWIKVRVRDGVEEVSLREVFRRAGEIYGLAGEIPTQSAALFRLLLVILNRSIPEHDHSPATWNRLWSTRRLPLEEIGTYLDSQGGRFDLLSPTTPFLQTAGLSAAKTSGLVKLIAEVPAGEQYFTTRGGRAITSLSYAEAARWVVHCQQFDVSGIKTGAHGDERVKGGKGYPIGTGFAGRCGMLIVEGESLRDTLLLNLVLPLRPFDAPPDLPIWERPPVGPGPDITHPVPTGPNDLTTWPIRRILLHHNGLAVTDVLITNGDPIHARNLHRIEMSTRWRRSANQEKQVGGTVYMPRLHDPAQALWRGMDGILMQEAGGGSIRNESPPALTPGVIEWLAEREHAGVLDPNSLLSLHAIGMAYGTQDSMIEATYDDSLRLRARVLNAPALTATAIQAVSVATEAVSILASLAGNIAAAAGREQAGARDRAREYAFHALDIHFRRWLAKLGTTDAHGEFSDWSLTCRTIVATEGARLVRDAGADAILGRHVNGKHLDAALADLWFRAALRKLFPTIETGTTKESPMEESTVPATRQVPL